MADSPELGSGHVSIIPTFKGFRKASNAEVDGATTEAGSRFKKGFSSVGSASGSAFSEGFRKSGTTSVLKQASADVASAAKVVATARLREQDAAGKVRVAEAGLADARSRYAAGSVQVVRAEERLASAERSLQGSQNSLVESSNRLAAAKVGVASASIGAANQSSVLRREFGQLGSRFREGGRTVGRGFSSGFRDVLGGAIGANIITGAGFAIGRALNDGIRAGIDFTAGSISLASDLNETTSAITQVFGSASKDIVAYSKTANTQLGQTRQQALLAAQNFGVFGKAAGLQQSKLPAFSTKLVTLAGDLASFYNTTPDDAIEALSAGLRGESEPLRRYGILLDDATERQEAFRLGIYNGKGALTQQQRILAANSLIFKESTVAQGDFQRTSGGLANQQRILNAQLQDTQAQLGQYLLPGFTAVVGYLNKNVLPSLGDVINRVGPKLGKAFEDAAPGIGKLLEKSGPLVDSLVDLGTTALPGVVHGLSDLVDRAPAAIDGLSNFFKLLNSPAAHNAADFTFGAAGGSANMFVDPDFWNSAFSESAAKRFDKKSADGQYGVIWKWFNSWWDPFADVADKAISDWWNGGFFGPGTDDGSKAFEKGSGLGDSFSGGLNSTDGSAQSAGEALSDAAFSGTGGLTSRLSTAGSFAGQGMADGIRSKLPAVEEAAQELADRTVYTINKAMRIQSPSKVTFQQGVYTGEGFALGIESRSGRVVSAAQMLSSAAQSVGFSSVGSSAAAFGAGGGPSDRPIYADGSLFGWIREMANGEAQLVVAGYDANRRAAARRGSRGF